MKLKKLIAVSSALAALGAVTAFAVACSTTTTQKSTKTDSPALPISLPVSGTNTTGTTSKTGVNKDADQNTTAKTTVTKDAPVTKTDVVATETKVETPATETNKTETTTPDSKQTGDKPATETTKVVHHKWGDDVDSEDDWSEESKQATTEFNEILSGLTEAFGSEKTIALQNFKQSAKDFIEETNKLAFSVQLERLLEATTLTTEQKTKIKDLLSKKIADKPVMKNLLPVDNDPSQAVLRLIYVYDVTGFNVDFKVTGFNVPVKEVEVKDEVPTKENEVKTETTVKETEVKTETAKSAEVAAQVQTSSVAVSTNPTSKSVFKSEDRSVEVETLAPQVTLSEETKERVSTLSLPAKNRSDVRTYERFVKLEQDLLHLMGGDTKMSVWTTTSAKDYLSSISVIRHVEQTHGEKIDSLLSLVKLSDANKKAVKNLLDPKTDKFTTVVWTPSEDGKKLTITFVQNKRRNDYKLSVVISGFNETPIVNLPLSNEVYSQKTVDLTTEEKALLDKLSTASSLNIDHKTSAVELFEKFNKADGRTAILTILDQYASSFNERTENPSHGLLTKVLANGQISDVKFKFDINKNNPLSVSFKFSQGDKDKVSKTFNLVLNARNNLNDLNGKLTFDLSDKFYVSDTNKEDANNLHNFLISFARYTKTDKGQISRDNDRNKQELVNLLSNVVPSELLTRIKNTSYSRFAITYPANSKDTFLITVRLNTNYNFVMAFKVKPWAYPLQNIIDIQILKEFAQKINQTDSLKRWARSAFIDWPEAKVFGPYDRFKNYFHWKATGTVKQMFNPTPENFYYQSPKTYNPWSLFTDKHVADFKLQDTSGSDMYVILGINYVDANGNKLARSEETISVRTNNALPFDDGTKPVGPDFSKK
ncbi:hypothetical protein ACA758_01860 [Mycoplasmopsis agassizii]|uniref:hypothetical protein n=1 Tax=Mycoplasmopsis agassizii TaxID=33922 RepID=UPI003528FDC5